MIPVEIDAVELIKDLNSIGWRDYKIEIACGYSCGYIAQVRCGNVRDMSYQRKARLFNFWEEETAHLRIQTLSETTT
ncbi:MAG TPA: hypothetical protein PK593_04105 [Thermomicrobiales bacterium]|nr:hypothetical protein [Thermomicrobiales bacterium]